MSDVDEYEVTAEVSYTTRAKSEEDAERKSDSYLWGRFEDDAANKEIDFKEIVGVEKVEDE